MFSKKLGKDILFLYVIVMRWHEQNNYNVSNMPIDTNSIHIRFGRKINTSVALP